MKNEFDELLIKRFEEQEFSFSQAGWDRLAKDLPPAPQQGTTRKLVWLRYTGIAASLLIAITALGWLFNQDMHTQQQETASTQPASPATIQPGQENIVPAEKQLVSPLPAIPANDNASPSSGIAHQQQHPPATKKNNLVPAKIQPDLANTYNRNTLQQPTPQEIIPQSPQQQVTEQPKEKVLVQNTTPTMPQRTLNAYPTAPSFSQEPHRKQGGKTLISVTGGFNYGSLNTGYMAGINAHQKLGNKFYIEGDLTLLNNKSDQAATVTASQFDAFNSGIASQRPVTNTVQQTSTNFLYLQFNPSVGYAIQKNLFFSIGADFQRWLDNNENVKTVVFTSSEEPKLIPGLDVGITGKTEYAVSKRLKAGLLYREGLNNVLHGSNEYFDRRYVQVQLKFRVFGK